MFLVVGAAAAVGVFIWGLVFYLVIRYERRKMTRVARGMSATVILLICVVLTLAYVIRADQEIVRTLAVVAAAYIIVGGLANIIAVVREREGISPNTKAAGRRK